MIASRFSWPAGTLFSKQNQKKTPDLRFLLDFSTAAKETNTQTHFQQPQVYFIDKHSKKKKRTSAPKPDT